MQMQPTMTVSTRREACHHLHQRAPCPMQQRPHQGLTHPSHTATQMPQQQQQQQHRSLHLGSHHCRQQQQPSCATVAASRSALHAACLSPGGLVLPLQV